MSIFDKPITTGKNSTAPSMAGTGGGTSIFSKPIVTNNQGPKVVQNAPAPAPKVTSQPSLIQKVGQFIISQVPKAQIFATAPQDVAPLTQPPQRTIAITPNQKRLTLQQLKTIAPQPVAGQSASMKATKLGAESSIERPSPITDNSTFGKVKSAFASGIETTKGNIKNTAALVVSKLKKEAVKNEAEFQKLAKKNPEVYNKQFFEERKSNIQGLSNTAEKIRQSAQASFDKSKEIRTKNIPVDNRKLLDKARDPEWLAISVAENLPNMLTSMGISVATLALTKNPYAAVVTGFAGSFSQEAGGAYQDAKEFGADTETAEKVAIQVGVGAGLLDALPIAKLLDRSPQGETIKKQMIKQMTKKILTQTTLEAGTESLQEIIANTVAQTYDKNRDFFQGVGESAIIGALMGGGSEVGGLGFDAATRSGEALEKKITALLPENINHSPQEVINAVIKSGLDTTPEGKTLMKSALEAQQAGTDLTISIKPEAIKPFFTPEQILKMTPEEQTKAMADIQDKTQKAVYLKQDTEIPKVIKIGENYSTLTPEQTVALRNEVGVIPDGTAEAGQVHLNIQSEMSRGNNKEVALSDLASQYPDVKKALDNAGIKLETDKNIAAKEAQQANVIEQVSTPPKDALRQEALKYKTAEEFVKAQFEKKPEYGMSHRPSYDGMPPASNLLEGDAIPKDVYEHPEYSIASGRNFKTDLSARQSWTALQKIRNKPDMKVTVYRAGQSDKLNTGDWITFSKNYAKDSLEGNVEKVRSYKIKAKDAIFAGDDINEFGYYPKSQLTDIWNKANEGAAKESVSVDTKTKPVADKPAEPLSPQDMEAAKARIEGRAVASAEMDAIPTNTDAQTPVGTGETKKSKAYTRVFDLLKSEFQQEVSYNVLNLEKDAQNAVDYIAKDPKSAIRIGLGLEQPPEGQTETAISIALAEKAATEGDYALQSRLESSRSLRQTRRGQEIVSERGRFGDDSPHKYMRELLNKRLANLGANVKDAVAEVVGRGRSMKQAAIDKIDAEVKKIDDAIKRDRKKIQTAQEIINSLICT